MINLHPAIVHFPIALLCVYALFEVLRIPTLTRQQWYFPLKAILVIIGAVSSYAAMIAGSAIEDAYQSALLEAHEGFAVTTSILFTIIAIIYLVAWFAPEGKWGQASKKAKWLTESWIIVVLAVIGAALVLITGALGGAMAYGADVDPFVTLIVRLLGLS